MIKKSRVPRFVMKLRETFSEGVGDVEGKVQPGRTILLLADDAESAAVLRGVWEQAGIRVQVLPYGEDADWYGRVWGSILKVEGIVFLRTGEDGEDGDFSLKSLFYVCKAVVAEAEGRQKPRLVLLSREGSLRPSQVAPMRGF
ncbi:MAG: hypothetical protein HC904_17625 [Blastochloris sp.]|nr:hypothetical protein [Blastochloris sp.]